MPKALVPQSFSRSYNRLRQMKHASVLSYSRMDEVKEAARCKLSIEAEIKLNPRFATLCDGLKKNHAHAVALVYPMIYLLRRVLFTCLVLYMQQYAYTSIHILIATSLAMITFALTESPWEDRLIGFQHLTNEVALYLVLVLLALFSGV